MNKNKELYRYTDREGSFMVANPPASAGLYFPLVNEEGLLSAITPDLKGDIKIDQHLFLNVPFAREDAHLTRGGRNFWVVTRSKNKPLAWSVSGNSVWQRSEGYGPESTEIKAGLLWHEVKRSNKKLGLEATVLNVVPEGPHAVEIMQVQIKNTGRKPLSFVGTAAIPLYGRSADNLRDHRHVTSLLNRIYAEKFGIYLKPTMSFNERGHLVNESSYFIVGCDAKGNPPAGFFPTVESFIGDGSDLENPHGIYRPSNAVKKIRSVHQGKEALGGLQFKQTTLAPGRSTTFVILLGIDRQAQAQHNALIKKYGSTEKVSVALEKTKSAWRTRAAALEVETGDHEFNLWFRWVSQQPVFRKLFGCSFLPDFDYGRGGRGWRDLWQDCLALLLSDPSAVREDLINNFSGVRIDGSNATIIARQRIENPLDKTVTWKPEFLADRNNIVRTWMDHGLWPYLTAELYINQTGDWDFLLTEVPYFKDVQLRRGQKKDDVWARDPRATTQLKTAKNKVHTASILEHILVQTLVPFFNVGQHNNIRLEDADWNDGMDMAHQKGESVAFTALFAGNCESLAQLLTSFQKQTGQTEVELTREVIHLLDTLKKPVNYHSPQKKQKHLEQYFDLIDSGINGTKKTVQIDALIADLRAKAAWIKSHLNKQEWLQVKGHGWFNGYYDNQGRRVEGAHKTGLRMTLTGQVFQIMAGVAAPARIKKIIKAVNKHLLDSKLGSVRLNTNFGDIQPDLGRAFSFSFGDKENGAIFSHMVVMYANALYQAGFVDEGHRALHSLYKMAKNSQRSRIYPGLPEYFNNEGRGLYHFLTGSASWYTLTLLTQVFGICGDRGDLKLAPKLVPAQFDQKGEARVHTVFAGSSLTLTYRNKKRVPFRSYKVKDVCALEGELSYSQPTPNTLIIKRDLIQSRDQWHMTVDLG